MITPKHIQEILACYDLNNLTIGVLGGHSALDVSAGAKKHGFKTLAVCQKGREKTYDQYYKTRGDKGCVDEVIVVDSFKDIVKPEIQNELQKRNTIFIHNRYFWVYCNFAEIENDFKIPIFGSRSMVKLEERDQPNNQYHLLQQAGIRIPKIFKSPEEIDRLVIVKAHEKARGYERAFFLAVAEDVYHMQARKLIKEGRIDGETLKNATIEEFVIGAQINLNFFYSPITKELELMGTDMRRQTNLDGLLRLPAVEQMQHLQEFIPKMIETGHVACTVKESLLEKIYDLGAKFVKITKQEVAPGIIGPFALQGAVTAEEGKEDIVIFDVSMRIPGSPGTRFTPYSGYLHGENLSYGDRIAMEIKEAVEEGKLEELVT